MYLHIIRTRLEEQQEFERLNNQLRLHIQHNRQLQIKYDQIQVRSIHSFNIFNESNNLKLRNC